MSDACNPTLTPPYKQDHLLSPSLSLPRGLFWYLERTVKGTLKWLYPTNVPRADEWLGEEIYR
jgi:hypothetical protein